MIACVGESLIDRIGDKTLIGGCPLNVAVAASRLGAPVTFFGKISSDEYGLSILEKMIDDGILFDPQSCNASEPTLCSKATVGEDGKASYTFDYEGTAACSMTEAELSASFANEGDIDLVFFGSISLLMEPFCDAIVPAMRAIQTRPRWFLDPNVRPSMVRDAEAYRKMIISLAGECDIVKVSEEDLSYLLPGLEPSEAEAKFLSMCRSNLLITRGENGSTWLTKDIRVNCPAFIAGSVVDTIGCGDTFDGAVIAYLQRNDLIASLEKLGRSDIETMLDYASKAAGLNCLFEGCDPPRRVVNADDIME
ncbi:MAG: carbohydrate kinase [Spirochaetales bacterium]|nr:carbohydrate kinase [Spirochaetales bacterium]